MLGSNYHFNMENIWANTGAKVEGEYSYDPDPALNSKIMWVERIFAVLGVLS